MKGSLKIGRIAGIALYIHWSFVLIIFYVIYTSIRDAQDILWSVLFVLSIFGTVLLHELGHALAARRYGIPTRDITLLPIGGVARLERFPEKPGQELVVAIAGPAVNVAIALVTFFFIDVPPMEELSEVLAPGVNAANFLVNFFMVNLWLALFNMIPAFPMDGGRVLRALLSFGLKRHVATRIAAICGQVIAGLFVAAGIFMTPFNPFLVLIGIFIFAGARAEADMVQKQYLLSGSRVRDAMMKELPALRSDAPVQEAARVLLNGQAKNFLVMRDNQPVGTVGRDEILRALSDGKSESPVENVMNSHLVYLEADQPVTDALQAGMSGAPALMLVRRQGQLLGVIDTENLAEFILVKGATRKWGSRRGDPAPTPESGGPGNDSPGRSH